MSAMRIGGSTSAWLRCCILLLLAERPTHGYELLGRMEHLGAYSIDSGTLYRVLRALEREGSASSAWEDADSGPARRVYELTGHGHHELTTITSELHLVRELVERFVARSEDTLTST